MEVVVDQGCIEFIDGAFDADLAAQGLPVKAERGTRVGGKLNAFAAFGVGEEAEGVVEDGLGEMNLSVRDNILLPSLDRLARGGRGRIDRAIGDRLVGQLMETLDIRPRQAELAVSALSGGNQQKVILAKWLAREVSVLLLEEPTQGVDVAAKAQIHALIRAFAKRGGGVLVRSSDLAELTLICDNILALHQGRITDRVPRSDGFDGFDEKRLHAAIGG